MTQIDSLEFEIVAQSRTDWATTQPWLASPEYRYALERVIWSGLLWARVELEVWGNEGLLQKWDLKVSGYWFVSGRVYAPQLREALDLLGDWQDASLERGVYREICLTDVGESFKHSPELIDLHVRSQHASHDLERYALVEFE